jgi:hypothetical protein
MRKIMSLAALAFFMVSIGCSLSSIAYKDPDQMITAIYLVLAAIACIQFWDKWHKK